MRNNYNFSCGNFLMLMKSLCSDVDDIVGCVTW